MGLIGLVSLFSCKKDKDPNHFSFDGTDYPIDSVALIEEVYNDGEINEQSVFQFYFLSITDGDTTELDIAVYDNNSNALSGNYPAIDQATASSADRVIFPFGILFMSRISFQDETAYYTGEGGSIDISRSGGTYSIDFNNISMGEYDDILDLDDNDDCEYTQEGRLNGLYNGAITKKTVVLSKDDTNGNIGLNKLIRKFQ